jgi:hypothetical protein
LFVFGLKGSRPSNHENMEELELDRFFIIVLKKMTIKKSAK